MLLCKTIPLDREVYLELSEVSKQYHDLKAVDKLSLRVFKGDIYGFLGPNGAGKSTSIRMMLSLISPDIGSIQLFGKDLSAYRYQILSRVGALIEKPDFYRYLSARKNLEILGKLSTVTSLPLKINEVLEMVRLTDRADSKVKTYSQGMRQRLGIAQCLLHDPDLIILDEPGNGLDPQGQKEMRDLILKLNREKGITILLSSHILSEIEQVANRMIIINKGKKVVEGDVSELLNGGGSTVLFELSDLEKAVKILQKSPYAEKYSITNEKKILVSIHREKIPELSNEFFQNEVLVFGIIPAQTLEDYFIRLTENVYPG